MGARFGVIAMFVIFSGVLYVNFTLLEVVGKNTPLANKKNPNHNGSILQLYASLGGLAWVCLALGLAAMLFRCCEHESYERVWAGIAICYSLAVLIIIFVCSLSEPFTKYREYKKGKDGLGSPQIRISCWADTHPIPVDSTYITLAETEWQPSLNSSILKTGSEHGWDYILSPILYNGPKKSCVIEPQIYAACFAKNTKGNEETVCGWERTDTVTIRKLDASPYLEDFAKEKLPCSAFPELGSKYGSWNKNLIFEWNTITRSQMIKRIEGIDTTREECFKRVITAWAICSGVLILLWALCPHYMEERCERAFNGSGGNDCNGCCCCIFYDCNGWC
eukprot:TRINITY_DN18760_c0_g1_i1.p1 TRINITY_DN18760_c0_g1~~TRINITY_DN18760_c0_g1_i1.p1  ORF type:complete len:335 (+),score=30.63 TRINITY_DN18760_c0_g1_i1:47-1051(+)